MPKILELAKGNCICWPWLIIVTALEQHACISHFDMPVDLACSEQQIPCSKTKYPASHDSVELQDCPCLAFVMWECELWPDQAGSMLVAHAPSKSQLSNKANCV